MLAAMCEDYGVPGYNNIPLTWKCHKDLCRIDGFASVDFTLISDREISFGAPQPTSTSSYEPISKQQEYSGNGIMSKASKSIF
jgi:hypothetical protein